MQEHGRGRSQVTIPSRFVWQSSAVGNCPENPPTRMKTPHRPSQRPISETAKNELPSATIAAHVQSRLLGSSTPTHLESCVLSWGCDSGRITYRMKDVFPPINAQASTRQPVDTPCPPFSVNGPTTQRRPSGFQLSMMSRLPPGDVFPLAVVNVDSYGPARPSNGLFGYPSTPSTMCS